MILIRRRRKLYTYTYFYMQLTVKNHLICWNVMLWLLFFIVRLGSNVVIFERQFRFDPNHLTTIWNSWIVYWQKEKKFKWSGIVEANICCASSLCGNIGSCLRLVLFLNVGQYQVSLGSRYIWQVRKKENLKFVLDKFPLNLSTWKYLQKTSWQIIINFSKLSATVQSEFMLV